MTAPCLPRVPIKPGYLRGVTAVLRCIFHPVLAVSELAAAPGDQVGATASKLLEEALPRQELQSPMAARSGCPVPMPRSGHTVAVQCVKSIQDQAFLTSVPGQE